MATQQFPTYNGVAPSWSNLQLNFGIYDGPSIQTRDVLSIDWSQSLELSEVRGLGGGLLARTQGQSSFEGSMTMTVTGWEILRRGLSDVAKQKDLPGYSLVAMDISAAWALPGADDVKTVTLNGIRITGVSSSNAAGPDAAQVELTLSIARIVEGDSLPLI